MFLTSNSAFLLPRISMPKRLFSSQEVAKRSSLALSTPGFPGSPSDVTSTEVQLLDINAEGSVIPIGFRETIPMPRSREPFKGQNMGETTVSSLDVLNSKAGRC